MHTSITGVGGGRASEASTQLVVITSESFSVLDTIIDEERIQNVHPSAIGSEYWKVLAAQ